jgi:hypothetical protein
VAHSLLPPWLRMLSFSCYFMFKKRKGNIYVDSAFAAESNVLN